MPLLKTDGQIWNGREKSGSLTRNFAVEDKLSDWKG